MKRPTVGIATDGAHSTKERLTRYRAVDLSSGLELFNHSIGNKTNNIGEFLAIVEAAKYILRHPEAPRIIYSDSITAITWYRKKQTASYRRCKQLLLAEIFLKVMAAKIDDIQVLHWDNREWGERLLQTLEIVNLIHKIITRITHLGKSLIIIIFTTEMYKLEVLI